MVVAMAVPSVHEDMNQRAGREQEIRQRAEDVHLVLIPQEVESDRAEQARTKPNGNAKRWTRCLDLCGHRGSLWRV